MDIETVYELRAAMKARLEPSLTQAFQDWAEYYCGHPSGFYGGLCALFHKADPENKRRLTHAYPAHALVRTVVDQTDPGSLWAVLGVEPMKGLQSIHDRELTVDQIMVSVEMAAQSAGV
jgi:hypothetical protein